MKKWQESRKQKQRLSNELVEHASVAEHLQMFLQGQPSSIVLSVPSAQASVKGLEASLFESPHAAQVQGQAQLQLDSDDAGLGNSLEPVRDKLFFRVVPLRVERQKVVAMPASRLAKLSQHDLCVTMHSAHSFGGEHVVSIEAQKSMTTQNPVAVLSLWNIELAELVEELTAWTARPFPKYVLPAIGDQAAEVTQDAVRKLVAARAFPAKDQMLHVALSDSSAIRQLHTLLDLRVVRKVEERDDCSMWVFTDFGASQLRVASQLQRPERVFKKLEDFSLLSLEDASCWQLVTALSAKGFQVRQKPRTKELVQRLPPHTPDNEILCGTRPAPACSSFACS